MSVGTYPASASRSAARPATSPCAHGQALIPLASTPTTRFVPCSVAAAIPISETISCVGRPVTGVVRRIGQRAVMCTSARTALCRSTMLRAIISAISSTIRASPKTASPIASSNTSGNRDMCTPFWPRGRSTVHSISAAITVSASPLRMRIAFCTPVTPARERASSTGGADACMSDDEMREVGHARNVAPAISRGRHSGSSASPILRSRRARGAPRQPTAASRVSP